VLEKNQNKLLEMSHKITRSINSWIEKMVVLNNGFLFIYCKDYQIHHDPNKGSREKTSP